MVPLLMAHNAEAFTVPNVHFYAVSTTAILCAGLAMVLGIVGIRRRDRRSAAIGAGFTVMAALLAVHGLTTPGFLIAGTTPRSASRARSPCRSAAGSSSPRCSRDRATAATSATSSTCRSASSSRRSVFGAVALFDPARHPEHPRRAAPARVVDRRRQRADLRRPRAARAAHVPAHPPGRRPGRRGRPRRGWRSPSPPTCSARPGRSGSGPGTSSSSARSSSSRARSRAISRVRRPRARSPRSTSRASSPRRRSCSAPGSRVCSRGSPTRTRRPASTRGGSRSSPSRSDRSSACAAAACAAWPLPRCCTTSASCRCRTRSSARPHRSRRPSSR